MKWLVINNRNYYISSDSGMSESIAKLKKRGKLEVTISKWNLIKDLEYLELLNEPNEFPKTLIIEKSSSGFGSSSYHWIFEDCSLMEFVSTEEILSQKLSLHRIVINFRFKNVWGTTEKEKVERDIKIKQILD